jgi:hypothetical protein
MNAKQTLAIIPSMLRYPRSGIVRRISDDTRVNLKAEDVSLTTLTDVRFHSRKLAFVCFCLDTQVR